MVTGTFSGVSSLCPGPLNPENQKEKGKGFWVNLLIWSLSPANSDPGSGLLGGSACILESVCAWASLQIECGRLAGCVELRGREVEADRGIQGEVQLTQATGAGIAWLSNNNLLIRATVAEVFAYSLCKNPRVHTNNGHLPSLQVKRHRVGQSLA